MTFDARHPFRSINRKIFKRCIRRERNWRTGFRVPFMDGILRLNPTRRLVMKFRIAMGIALLSTATMAAHPVDPRRDYHVVPLVSDQPGVAPNTDPNLVNPLGISQAPGNPLWVSDNGTDLSTLYDPNSGAINSLVVKIPPGAPTGTVFVPPGTGFPISQKGVKDDSIFLFDTEGGAILGWSNNVNLNKAIVAVDNSAKGSAYKGLAYDDADVRLFAADFVNNEVQAYDKKWNLTGTFTDSSLPKHFAPFNVAWLKNKLYVSFAKREAGGIDDVAGKGLVTWTSSMPRETC
jgi:uncharacterized protein (TIGR03118 family)